MFQLFYVLYFHTDLPRSLYKLVKDSIVLSSVLGSALAAYLLTGYTSELPTYLRLQFRSDELSAAIASSRLITKNGSTHSAYYRWLRQCRVCFPAGLFSHSPKPQAWSGQASSCLWRRLIRKENVVEHCCPAPTPNTVVYSFESLHLWIPESALLCRSQLQLSLSFLQTPPPPTLPLCIACIYVMKREPTCSALCCVTKLKLTVLPLSRRPCWGSRETHDRV